MIDITRAAPALVAALRGDPFYQAITVDFRATPSQSAGVLEQYFAYSLAEAERTGRCELAADPTLGASAWLLPRSAEVESRESAAKAAFLAQTLGPLGLAHYGRIIDFMSLQSCAVVPSTAWYLSIIALAPAAQGRNLGNALLLPTLAEADAAGATCYLETFSPRNPKFYERIGFHTRVRLVEPCTGAAYAIMVREPAVRPPAP